MIKQTILVYYPAGDYIITLSLDLSSPHNLNRKYVVDANFAEFRCKQEFVISIEHKDDPTKVINEINSDYNKSFKYTCGEIINENEYDNDVNRVYAKGIYFYKTKEAAYRYATITSVPSNYCGIRRFFNKNGQKIFETHYVDGKENGISSAWYENGRKYFEHNYVYGEENGISSMWYENGRKQHESHFIDGELNGICRGVVFFWTKRI